ncbi:MAG: glycerophosphodiester phosphodiesterase [Gammaproteobacteria bacterium]|nr:glycerophosphodiester phosphodiesterase [Gammaproteobacteria bacterium]
MPINHQSRNFLIIGHRGAKGENFENSLSGFEHALGLNIDAIELDIRAHNGELWVIHDDDLKRLTGQAGYFHGHPDPADIRLNNGEAIPKLREVLDLYWGKMPINIEIKSFDTALLLIDLLAEYPALPPNPTCPWILISSFDRRQILQLRNDRCPWDLAPITAGIPMEPDNLINKLRPYSWHMDKDYLDFDLINSIQAQGIRVMVYTVNDINLAHELKQAGIDGVFTDFPSTFQLID